MMRRLLQPFWVLLAVIFLIEAWLWDHLEPIVERIVALIPLRAFKQWLSERVDTLSPAMTLIVLKAVCNCFICFFEVLCSWLMTLICRFRPSLATAQTNRFALRFTRESAQRVHSVRPAGV